MTVSATWRAWSCLWSEKTTLATPSLRKQTFWKWPSVSCASFPPLPSKVSVASHNKPSSRANIFWSYHSLFLQVQATKYPTLSFPPSDSAESYREGYKACLQRVSALLPKSSLDQDACQRMNEFIQQSTSAANVTPTCRNCCAQSSRALPQIQQRLQSLKCSFTSRLESQSRSSSSGSGSGSAVAPSPAQQLPQAVSSAMWRPW